jgi:hypothetical protein
LLFLAVQPGVIPPPSPGCSLRSAFLPRFIIKLSRVPPFRPGLGSVISYPSYVLFVCFPSFYLNVCCSLRRVMHSSWTHLPVVDSEQTKPRASSGLSFSGAHLLDSQHLATSRSHSVPLLSVTYHSDQDHPLWQPPRPSPVDSRRVTVDSTRTAQHDASPSSYEQRPSPVPQQQFGQDNWLSYPGGGLATVSEEPLEAEIGEKQPPEHLEPAVSPPSDLSASEAPPNMR